ncbi:Mucolipin-1, partial [Clonorchis sinensis]
DGGGTRLWHSFGHRHPASHSYHQSDRHTQQHQPQPQQQSHNQSTAAPQPSAPAAPSLRGQSADYPHLAECSECVCTHHRATVTSLSSPIPFVTSPRPAFPTRDGLGHSQRPTGLDTATGTSMTQSQVGQRMQPVQTTDHQPGRSHTKHQRRAVRRGVSGWRSGDRSKSAAVPVVGDALPEPVTSKTTVSRSHNLAERDPQAFFRVLSEKLQHVLDNQLATERLDRIMTDTSPVPPHSTGDQTTDVLTTADKQPDPTEDTTIASSASMAVSTAAAPELAVPTTVPDARQSGLAVSSLLQRPWADRLLAAARIHENTRDNAQAILEDHCSRIWAASADRTPTSSGSGSGGAGGGEVGVLGSAGTNTLMTETDNAVRLYELGCRSLEPAFHLKTHQPVTHAKQNEVEDGSRSLHSPRSRSSSRCSEVAGNPLQSTRSRHHALLPSGKEGEMWPSDSMVAASGVQPGAPLGQQSGKECTVDSQPAPDSPSSCMSSYVESSASPGMLPTTLPCGRLPNMESSVRSVGLQVAASSVLPCITTPHSVSSSSTTTSVVSVSTPGLPVSSPSSGSPHSLVIGYYLGDDPVPYRSLWPSAEITLGQFKQLIPKKKGSFRYFFKKLSNEFGSGVVHQEITNDSCLLPLWEGKPHPSSSVCDQHPSEYTDVDESLCTHMTTTLENRMLRLAQVGWDSSPQPGFSQFGSQDPLLPDGYESEMQEVNEEPDSQGKKYSDTEIFHWMGRRLSYFFMSPMQKFRAKGQIPYKLFVQLIKVVTVTIQFNQTEDIAIGSYLYRYNPPQIRVCRTEIAVVSMKEETDCATVEPRKLAFESLSNVSAVMQLLDLHNLSVSFPRLLQFTIQFELITPEVARMGWTLESVCFLFKIAIIMNKVQQSGQLKIHLDAPYQAAYCSGLTDSVYSKNATDEYAIGSSTFLQEFWTQLDQYPRSTSRYVRLNRRTAFVAYLNYLVLIVGGASIILCIRSLVLGFDLWKESVQFFKHWYSVQLRGHLWEFVQPWFLVIVFNDLIIVSGAIGNLWTMDKVQEKSGPISYLFGVNTLLVWSAVLRYVGFSYNKSILMRTIASAVPALLRFAVCSMVLFFAFSLCGWAVLGPYHLKFRTFLSTLESLFSLINGDDMYVTFSVVGERAPRSIYFFSRLFLYLFITLFVYIILNLFISIIFEAYEEVKEMCDTGGRPRDSLLFNFLHQTHLDCSSPEFRQDDNSPDWYVMRDRALGVRLPRRTSHGITKRLVNVWRNFTTTYVQVDNHGAAPTTPRRAILSGAQTNEQKLVQFRRLTETSASTLETETSDNVWLYRMSEKRDGLVSSTPVEHAGRYSLSSDVIGSPGTWNDDSVIVLIVSID